MAINNFEIGNTVVLKVDGFEGEYAYSLLDKNTKVYMTNEEIGQKLERGSRYSCKVTCAGPCTTVSVLKKTTK